MARFSHTGESDIVCPPTDVYVLRFVEATTPELVDGWNEQSKPEHERKKVLRTQLTFKIVDYPYDDDDYDEDDPATHDWNNFEIKNFYTVGKDFNHEKSKLGAILRALLQVESIDLGEDIDTDAMTGKRIKATIAPKASGYPGIESPLIHRTKKNKPAPKAVAPEDDDGADLFDEDAA